MEPESGPAGEAEEFERLFRTLYPELCDYATRLLEPAEAEDVVASVFATMWRRQREGNRPDRIRAYLFAAVRNQALKHLRNRKVSRRLRNAKRHRIVPRLHSPNPIPGDQLNLQRIEARVRACLEELPPRPREVFILSRHHGLSRAEIASVLGISVKTVENHMTRALGQIREAVSSLL